MAVAQDKRASELTAPVSIADTDTFPGYRPGTGGEPNLDIRATAGLLRAPFEADALGRGHLITAFAGADFETKLDNALLSGETRLVVPAGTHDITSIHNVYDRNLVLAGVGRDACRIRTTLSIAIRVGGTAKVAFEDIYFESTLTTATQQYGGLLCAYDESLVRSVFTITGFIVRRCGFTMPGNNNNAFGLYAQLAGDRISNIYFDDNLVEEMGGGGIAFQNHQFAAIAYRMSKFWIGRNVFRNLGLTDASYGMAATLSGAMEHGWVSDNNIHNFLGIGLEMASGNRHVHFIRNGFSGVTRRGADVGGNVVSNPISISTNQTPAQTHAHCSVVGNFSKSDEFVTGGIFFGNMNDCEISDNNFTLEDNVSIRDCQRLRGGRNRWTSKAAKPMVIIGTTDPCKNNVFHETFIDASARASAVTAMVSFEGTAGLCDQNELVGGRLNRPAAGGAFVSTNDASNSRNVVSRMTSATNGTDNTTWTPSTVSVAITDADQSLNLIDAQNENIRLTGSLTAGRTISLPRNGSWTIWNNTTNGWPVSVAPPGGTGVSIPAGTKRRVSTRTGDAFDMTANALVITPKTANYTVTAADCAGDTRFSNVGASGTITFALPASAAGQRVGFYRSASQAVRVDPNGSQIIGSGGAGKYLSIDSDGGFALLECIVAGIWVPLTFGTITYEP